MIDPLFPAAMGLGLGLLFIVSAVHKMLHRSDFRVALDGYVLVPRAAAGALAWIVPVMELASGGVALLLPFGANVVALWPCSILLIAYSAAMLANIRAGKIYVDCGCLGFGAKRDELKTGMVVRNMMLSMAAILAMAPTSSRTLGMLDWVSLAFAMTVAAILYAANETLLNLPRRSETP